MNTATAYAAPADITDAAADAWEDAEVQFALAQADELLDRQDAPEGPAEHVAALTAAYGWTLRALAASGGTELARETAARAYKAARSAIDAWRIAAGCEDWAGCTWTAEVSACAECDEALSRQRVKHLDLLRPAVLRAAERLVRKTG